MRQLLDDVRDLAGLTGPALVGVGIAGLIGVGVGLAFGLPVYIIIKLARAAVG